MSVQTLELPGARLTRVAYVDVPIDAETVGLSPSNFAQVPWRAPHWSEGEQVRVGVAAWFADIAGKRVVFDPVQAADGVLRADRDAERTHQAAIAERFADAGFARQSVDLVVISHVEDVGMVGLREDDGSWSPFFPNARVLLSAPALGALDAAPADALSDATREAFGALRALGAVDAFEDGQALLAGLFAEVKGGHGPGHAVMHFGADPGTAAASLIGHLALSPLHLATGPCERMHQDAAAAWELLQEVARDGRLLIGPLWPAPGFGRWLDGAFAAGQGE